MTNLGLTYCGNVHPAENLAEWIAVVGDYSALVAADHPGSFGLGVWWNAAVAAELAGSAAARDEVRGVLAAHDLYVSTLNVFPFGGFHAHRVKEGVYTPSWADAARVRYTLDAAAAVSALRTGGVVPLSTLPIGYGAVDENVAAANLIRVAEELDSLAAATGVQCIVALEPEPFCILERVDQTAKFLEERVFGARPDLESKLRRHLGVCVDLCHLAVVGEDPLAALADLRARGIAAPKVQVSSCLELRSPEMFDDLVAYEEPRYLHQTVSAAGPRALDLPEVRARADEFRAAGRVRSHFHLPVFWDAEGLGSTRSEVERVVPELDQEAHLLEVETYTWGVLGRQFAGMDLVEGLREELRFVRSLLRG